MDFELLTLGQLLEKRANEYGDKVYLLFNGEVVSYKNMDKVVNRVANAFTRLGVTKGSTVNVHLSNRPEFVCVFFALAKIGATMNPTNPALTTHELKYIVDHSDAELSVTEPEYINTIQSVQPDCPKLRKLILVNGATSREDLLTWEEFIHEASDTFSPNSEHNVSDVAVNMYTSGTTSLPKGVLLTHQNIISDAHSWMWLVGFTPNDRTMSGLPLCHANALFFSLVGSMVFGGSFVLLEKLSISNYLAIAKQYRVTHFNFFGAGMGLMLKRPEDPSDTDHPVRVVHNAMGSGDMIEKWSRRFKIKVVMVYNLTECALATGTPVSGPNPVKLGSIGWAAPSQPFPTEVLVVDEEGREVPPGAVGEIIIRGPGLMKGYHKDQEKTAETVVDGWLHTGDAGYGDEDGCLWFSDRMKDTIKPKGENVSSAEVEGVICGHPKVADAAVIGVPDPVTVEEIKSSILLMDGETPDMVTLQEILEMCKERLAAFKVPRYYEFRDKPIPRILGGAKILKRELRKENSDNPTRGCFDIRTGAWLD